MFFQISFLSMKGKRVMKNINVIFLVVVQAFVSVSLSSAQVLTSALHEAVLRNDVTKVRSLLENGEDVNLQITHGIPQDLGATPLHFAIQYPKRFGFGEISRESIAIIYLLMCYGADLTLQTHISNNTPLHCAVHMKNEHVVVVLKVFSCFFNVELGDNLKNSRNQTPVEFAMAIKKSVLKGMQYIDYEHVTKVIDSMSLIEKYLKRPLINELSPFELQFITREYLGEYAYLLFNHMNVQSECDQARL